MTLLVLEDYNFPCGSENFVLTLVDTEIVSTIIKTAHLFPWAS